MSLAKRAIESGVEMSPSEESRRHAIEIYSKIDEAFGFLEMIGRLDVGDGQIVKTGSDQTILTTKSRSGVGVLQLLVDEHGKVLVSKIIPEEEV